MARIKTITGRIITVFEYSGSDPTKRHWFVASGTFEAVMDYLNENGVPEHKVKSITLSSSTWYAWYHK